MKEFHKFLRDNPFFWSRLGFCYDPPRAGADGKQILFSHELDEYVRVHRDFEKAGVKLHTTILHSGWVGDGKYDYTLTDEILDALFEGDPDIYYMPRIKLNVPPDWCRNHPEDTFVYYFGPREAEEIAALAETDKHDYFGFEGAGYSVNGGKGIWKDDRVNYGGLIGLQSFSSKKWVEDASETLRRILAHLAESKYRERIIGVHVAYGMCGETNLWGAWSPINNEARGLFGRRGDFGINNRRRFAEYGIAKYGSREAAIEKWGDLEPPTPIEREAPCEKLSDLFFNEGDKARDYFEFVSQTNVEAIDAYCKIVKEASEMFGHELAAGAFYGYMYLPQSANAGHAAIGKLMQSPNIDFMSSPKGYYRCQAGDPGGEQGPSESIARKLVWLDEIDCWTHLDRRSGEKAANLDESITLLWREAVKNVTHGQGFWWMDLGEGWYDCPELMAEITKITALQARVGKTERKSAAEVLLVVDENSIKHTRICYGLNGALLYELHSELKLIGAPVDTLMLPDLYEVDLSQYKFIVFANIFSLDAGERERLLPLIKDKLVLWHYAAGAAAPDYAPENFTELTGFTLTELGTREVGYKDFVYSSATAHKRDIHDYVNITIDAPGMEVITRCPTGEVNLAIKDKVAVCANPSMTRNELRMLAKRAGVNILCDADCAVFADNRIVGFFPKERFKGEIVVNGERRSVEFPAKGRYVVEL